MRRSGVRIPLAPPQADIRSGCRFLYAWARWCGACCCGPTGVPGACWAGLLGVPVGGGPPASRPRRELRPARRLEARPGPATAHGHRSQALSRPPDPPAPSTPAAPGVLTCGSARRHDARPGPAAAHGHRGRAPGPSGALRTGGTVVADVVWCVVSKPSQAQLAAHRHRGRASQVLQRLPNRQFWLIHG